MIQLRDSPELAHQNIYLYYWRKLAKPASQGQGRAVAVAVAAPGHLAMEMEMNRGVWCGGAPVLHCTTGR